MSALRQIRLLLALMSLLWFFGTCLVGQHVYRGVSSGKWVRTECLVVSAGSSGLKYHYQTPDGMYEGTRRSFKLSGEKPASSYPAGSKISCYVDPANYHLSALETGTDAISIFSLLIAMSATLLSIAALRRAFKTDFKGA